jgi:UPF0755 protein
MMDAHVWLKRVMYVLVLLIALSGVKFLTLYRKAYAPNIFTPENKDVFFYITTGTKYEDVIESIKTLKIVRNINSLEWVAQKKNYPKHVYPGRYLIQHRMSNNELINMLRSGKQKPLNLTFNNLRTLKQLSDRVSEQLEFSSSTLMDLLTSDSIQKKYGFNKYTINCMFISNTYEIYWNISPKAFLDRMYKEYNSFWNIRRKSKAEKMGMSREEVMTLASIVNEETRKADEKSRIAGVYINRLNKSIRLQADPTVIYGLGNFNMNRVLRKHYQIESPFNTYLIDGLPPGPICFPDISTIDAVLNFEKHNYYYFCARPDFSGYHTFARTLEEHNRNAALYRRELDKRRIYH